MPLLKHEKQIVYFVVTTFIVFPVFAIMSLVIFPPDFSKQFPVYDANSIMLMVIGSSLEVAGLTVMGIKLADEKKVLPAAGFTMLAISCAILMSSIFEITEVISYESYVKFYRIQVSGNFLYVPAMYLISAYEDFRKWIRYVGLVSSLMLITASFMFLFGNRDFKTLETISNIGYSVLFLTMFSWAYNIYINYKKVVKAEKK